MFFDNFVDFGNRLDNFGGVGSGGALGTEAPGKNGLKVFYALEVSGIVSVFHWWQF